MRKIQTPPHLRVIEGKKKEEMKEGDFRRRMPLLSAALFAAGLCATGISSVVASYSGNTGNRANAIPVIIRDPRGDTQWHPQESASDRMKALGNRELIAKLARDVRTATPHEAVESNMASLILETRGAGAVSELGAALISDPSPVVREHAAFILGRIGDAGALPGLRSAAVNDGHPDVRSTAGEAAKKIENRE